MSIFAWRPTLTLAMKNLFLVIVVIKNLFLGATHLLARTLSRGEVKNNTLSLSIVEAEYRAEMHASS